MEGAPDPGTCPNCGRRRLTGALRCLSCGGALSQRLAGEDVRLLTSPKPPAYAGRPVVPEEVFRIGDDACSHERDLVHPLYDPVLDAEVFDAHALTCRYCGEATRHLKQFALPKMLVFYFVIEYEAEPIKACPGCMRWYLAKFLLCNLVTANVLWPIVSLLPSLYFLAMTFRKGHSSGL